jgi:hypothetical protein
MNTLLIVVLAMLVLLLARAVIRLENYHYATVVGICGKASSSNL